MARLDDPTIVATTGHRLCHGFEGTLKIVLKDANLRLRFQKLLQDSPGSFFHKFGDIRVAKRACNEVKLD